MSLRLTDLLVVTLLAGCASGQNPYADLGRAAQDLILPTEPSTATGAAPRRAAFEQLPSPVISVAFQDSAPVFIVPVAETGGYRSYQDRARRGVVLFGGAVAGTDGLGQDLLAVRHAAEDPIAHPRPLLDWPGQYDRSYQYRVRDGAEFAITVSCVVDVAAREAVTILEREYQTVRIVESCASPRRRFANTYWVAPETGQVWRSRQWLGPRLNPVTIEVINP